VPRTLWIEIGETERADVGGQSKNKSKRLGWLKLGMTAGRWVLSSRYNQGTGEAGGAALTLMQWDVGRCGPPSPQFMQGVRDGTSAGRRDALQRRG
jgi:hypothetical protein